MAKIILVTGGTRSGKSSIALEIAESFSARRLFIATSPKVDPEMSERIRRHKEERKGRGWFTVESETDLAGIFREQSAGFDVILLDCVTLWVNNVLFQYEHKGSPLHDSHLLDLCREWLHAADSFKGTLICVTNEVGLGIVPENRLARRYRDLVGTCNQEIGRKAEEVILVSCGIPLYLKKKQKNR